MAIEKVLIIVTFVLCVIFTWAAKINAKPAYISDAESRVSSYLTSEYGGITCDGIPSGKERWELHCQNKSNNKIFLFSVEPGENSQRPVSRSFALTVMNENAIESAQVGLMRYLSVEGVPK